MSGVEESFSGGWEDSERFMPRQTVRIKGLWELSGQERRVAAFFNLDPAVMYKIIGTHSKPIMCDGRVFPRHYLSLRGKGLPSETQDYYPSYLFKRVGPYNVDAESPTPEAVSNS